MQSFLSTGCRLTCSELQILRDELYGMARIAAGIYPNRTKWDMSFSGVLSTSDTLSG